MKDWFKSRKFVGTVVLVVLMILDANGWVKIPQLAVQTWMVWVGAEALHDTAKAYKQG